MIPRVDIEEAFGIVVKRCGGELLIDIVGKSPPFANADYLFRQDKVIAELKTLMEDKINDPVMKKRLGDLWIAWRHRSLVSGPTPPLIDSRTLPTICQNEMCRVMGEPIRRCIQKANAQIRATKSALDLPDYHGVLFLANNGNLIFEMPVMIHLIYLSLKDHFSQIDAIVFFSGNMVSIVVGLNCPARFWIGLLRDETVTSISDLSNRLSLEWCRHHAALTGTVADPSEIGDMEFFSREMKSRIGPI